MSREELKQTLGTLHETLSEVSEVDDKTRDLLHDITSDIERLLADEQPTAPDESFSGRLKDLVVEFEARHPQIGGLLERLSDGLANMGI